MILENIYVFKILKQISLKLGMPVGCFFSHHSVTVAGIRSPAMRKQTHDDLISNFGETPSDPRCELIEQWPEKLQLHASLYKEKIILKLSR